MLGAQQYFSTLKKLFILKRFVFLVCVLFTHIYFCGDRLREIEFENRELPENHLNVTCCLHLVQLPVELANQKLSL